MCERALSLGHTLMWTHQLHVVAASGHRTLWVCHNHCALSRAITLPSIWLQQSVVDVDVTLRHRAIRTWVGVSGSYRVRVQ